MSTALSNGGVAEYVRRIATANPAEAVQIALAEAEREKAIAAQDKTEYLAMAEVKFARDGSIADANLAGLYRLAQMYSRTEIVPEHYRLKPDDCFIACQMAFRLHIDPLAYMQNSYVVYGKPGIESKLAIALLNQSGKIRGRIRWKLEGVGQTRKCTAFVTDAESGDTFESPVDWAMVKAEGWDTKKGSKWVSMPDVMFRYRSAAFLIRQYYPEVLMGISLGDELEDEGPAVRAEPARVSTVDGLLNQWQGQRTVDAAQPKLPESSDGRVAGGEPETAITNPASQSQDSKPAAHSQPPLDRNAALADFDEAERASEPLTKITEVLEGWMVATTNEEGDWLRSIANESRARVKAKRGAGSKALATAE